MRITRPQEMVSMPEEDCFRGADLVVRAALDGRESAKAIVKNYFRDRSHLGSQPAHINRLRFIVGSISFQIGNN